MKACERQTQLAKNQKLKADLVIAEVDKASGAVYRSLGRMFVMQPKTELMTDLQNDLKRIAEESKRQEDLSANLLVKKETLINQLNALSPEGK